MQFDRHGNRIWRQRPSAVRLRARPPRRRRGRRPVRRLRRTVQRQSRRHACPYRFRCAGCDHFRTDVSYLPDLHAYLDDLLRTRERLLATTDVDDWARAEATPSDEEITRIRRLINRISGGLDELTPNSATTSNKPSPSCAATAASCSACPAPAKPCPTCARSAPHDHQHHRRPTR